jgi:hypothetical protein
MLALFQLGQLVILFFLLPARLLLGSFSFRSLARLSGKPH